MAGNLGDLMVRIGIDVGNFKETMQGIGELADKFGLDFSTASEKIISKQLDAEAALSKAQVALAELTKAYDAGAVTADVLSRAAEGVQRAFERANPALAETKLRVEEAAKAAEEARTAFEHFAEGVAEFIEHLLQSAGESVKSFLLAIGPMGTIALGAAAG